MGDAEPALRHDSPRGTGKAAGTSVLLRNFQASPKVAALDQEEGEVCEQPNLAVAAAQHPGELHPAGQGSVHVLVETLRKHRGVGQCLLQAELDECSGILLSHDVERTSAHVMAL